MQDVRLAEERHTVYVLLAIFLGGLGLYYFYLGRTTPGTVHLALCWTLVPSLLAIAHAINSGEAVRERNMEIAQSVAVTLNVPAEPMLLMAMIRPPARYSLNRLC